MILRAGTSGFSYAPWKGPFYPEKLPAKQMLTYYASKLPAVELNNTFYRMPKASDMAAWAAQTPADFRFVVKAPKRITHIRKLVEAEADVAHLHEVSNALGEKRGPVLFQLPPFQRADLPRLEAFLATLRANTPLLQAAFEFRHESWFHDDVYAALAHHGAALCIADDEKLTTPFVATTAWGYLRLRRPGYDEGEVRGWHDRIRAQTWSDAFVFFKHEDAGIGPNLALQLLALAAASGPGPM